MLSETKDGGIGGVPVTPPIDDVLAKASPERTSASMPLMTQAVVARTDDTEASIALDRMLKRENQSEILMATMSQASGKNPDAVAEADKVGKSIGVDVTTAMNNMIEARRRALMNDVRGRNLPETSPLLAESLTNPEFANVAHDDIENLSFMERYFKNMGDTFDNLTSAIAVGMLQTDQAYMNFEWLQSGKGADIDPIFANTIKAYGQGIEALHVQEGWTSSFGTVLGQQVRTLPEVAPYVATGAAAGAARGLFLGTVAGAVLPPTEIAAAPLGFLSGAWWGAGLGARTGFGVETAKQEAGGIYASTMRATAESAARKKWAETTHLPGERFTFDEFKGNDAVARPIAYAGGAINGLVETFLLGTVTKSAKGILLKTIRGEANKVFARKMTQKGTMLALYKIGKQMGLEVGGNVVEEVSQEIVSIIADQLAVKMADPNAVGRLDTEEGRAQMLDELWDIAIQTAQGMIVMGGTGPAINLYVHRQEIRDMRREQKFLTDLISTAEDSPLRKRAPGTLEAFLAKTARGTNAENIYVNADTLREELEKTKTSMEALEAVVPGIKAQLDAATTSDDDVMIPTATFAAKLVGTELGSSLRQHIRLSAPALSLFEQRKQAKYLKQQVEDAKKLLDESNGADADFVRSANVVRARIEKQLADIGSYSDDEAATMAEMATAWYVTTAVQNNMTPEQVHAMRPNVIESQADYEKRLNDTYDQGGNLRTDNAKFIEKFKNTKTVDKDGKIIRLYHATSSPDDFDALAVGPTGIFGRGVYLTDSAVDASEMPMADGNRARIFPQYAAINNPFVTNVKTQWEDMAAALNMPYREFSKLINERRKLGENERDIFTDLLTKAGYDGIQVKFPSGVSHWVAFKADQLESAVLEQGTFSQNMSTRLPSGKKALENGVTELLTADYEAFLRDPTFIAKNLELFKKLGAPIRIDESKSPKEQIEQILDHMASNLLFIHDEMDATQRERAKQWYMGGRKMVDWMAARHGISPMQAAALYAVLSPQKDWFENVSLGNRIADIASTQRNRTMSLSMQTAMIQQLESEALAVTQQMNSVASALKQASAEMQSLQEQGAPIAPVLEKPKRSETKKVKNAYGVQVRKADAAAKKYARQLQQVTDRVTNLTAALTDLQASNIVAQAYATNKIGEAKKAFEDIGTRTLGDLLNAGEFGLAAIVTRWTDFEINSPNYSVITPEGGAGALRLTQSGAPSSIRWGTYEAIAKALSVFTDGSVLNVHYQIGNEHKVRNFYNNLFDPSDERFATIDTHAIAAAYMLPLSGADALVVHGLGGLTQNAGVGLGGAYALIFEAYKRAAKSRDISPREMQSITWEAIRGMFEAANKKTLKAPVAEVWQDYKDGKISIGRARRKVVRLASGITTPAWVGTPTSIPPGSGYSGNSQVDGDKYVPPQPVRLEVKSNFEVAPNPKDKKAVERWNMLTVDQQADVSMQVAKVTVRRVLDHWGATAQFVPQEGGYQGISSASFALLLDPSVRTRAICQDLCEALSQASIFTISQNPFGDASIPESMSTESESVVIGLAPGTTPAQIRNLFENDLVPIGVTAHSTVEGFMVIVVDGDATATFEAIQAKLKGDPRIVIIYKGKAWTAFDGSKKRNSAGSVGQDNRRRRIGVLRREANAIIDAYVAVKQYKSGGYPSTAGNSAASPRPGPNDQVNQPPLPSKAPAAFRVTRLESVPTDGIKPLVIVRNALNERFGTQVIDRLIALGDAGKRGGVVIVSNVIELASKFKELTGRDLDAETLESQKADRLKAQGTARAWVIFAEAKKLVDFGKIKTLEDAAILAEANYQDTINRVPKFDAQAYVDEIANVALEFIPVDFRPLVQAYRTGNTFISKDASLGMISDLVLKIRLYNIERWKKTLNDPNGAYLSDPFFRSYVATNLINGLRPDYINEGQIFHPAALSLLYAQTQTGKIENFEKVYSAILLKVTEDLVKLGNADDGWRKVPMTKADDPLFDEAVANVRSISHKDWCTRTYNAPVYIQDGDFWVYVKNKKPALAILFQQNNTVVDQIQGPLNNREIPPEDVHFIQELIDSGQLPNINDRTKKAIKDATDAQRVLEERVAMFPGFADVTEQLFAKDQGDMWVSADPRYSMIHGFGDEFKILKNPDSGEIIGMGQFHINGDCPSLVSIDNSLDEDGRTPHAVRIQGGITLANLKQFTGRLVKARQDGDDMSSPTRAINFPELESFTGTLTLIPQFGVNNDVDENKVLPGQISQFPKLRTYHGTLTMDGRETHMPVLEDIRGSIKAQHVTVNSLPSFRRILEDDYSAGNRGERSSEFNYCDIPTLIEIRVANLERSHLDGVTTSNGFVNVRRGSSMNALVVHDGEALVSDTSQMLSLRNLGGLTTDVDNEDSLKIFTFKERFPLLEHVQQRITIDNEDLKISVFPNLRSCGGLQHVHGTVLVPQLLECNGSWNSGTVIDAPLCEFITGGVNIEDTYTDPIDSLSLELRYRQLESNKARAQKVKEYEQKQALILAGETQRTIFPSLKSIGDAIEIRGNVTLPSLNRVSNQDMELEGNVSMPALRRIESRMLIVKNGVHLPNLEFCNRISAEHCHLPMLVNTYGTCEMNSCSAPQLISVDGTVEMTNGFVPRLKYVRDKITLQDTIFPQLLACGGFVAVVIRNNIPPAPKLKYCLGEMSIATFVNEDRLSSRFPLKQEGIQFPALEFVGSDITGNYPIIAPKLTTVRGGATGFFVAPTLDVVGGYIAIKGNSPMRMTDRGDVFRTVSLKNSVPLLLKQPFSNIEKDIEIFIRDKAVNKDAVTLRRPGIGKIGTYEEYIADPGLLVRRVMGNSPETISFTKKDWEKLAGIRYLFNERKDWFDSAAEKIAVAISRDIEKRKMKLRFSKASVPASGVFDASKPPISSEPIFAVMNADGTIYYDRSATMHGDLVEAFPEIADTTIDGGFIIDGKYKMSTSDGGFSALEGTDEQVQQVKEFTRQANEAVTVTEQESTTSVDNQGGATQGLFDPQSGLHFLVADELTEQTAPAVLAHEITHGVSTPEMEESALDLVANRDIATNSEDLFDFLERVAQRIKSAGVVGNGAEAMGYIVEEALIAGRQDGFSVIDDTLFGKIVDRFGETVADLVKKFVAWVRARLAERGADLQLSVDDMLAIAERGMHRASRGGAESRSPTATTFKTSNSVRDQSYSQADTGGADRGRFNPKTLTTTLTKLADLSTFLHETGHFWLESLAFAASLPTATDQQKADFQAVLDWFGVADKAAWDALSMDEKRQHHEAWAYNVEIYFSEGKSPSVALEGVFARYAKWLGKIYTNIRDDLNAIYRKENGKDLPMLTGEIRQVMDRVLASQQQIEHAAAVRNMVPMYQTQEQSGMNDMEWKEYQDLAEEWRLAAIVDLTKASMRQIQWLSNARSRVLANLQKEHDKIRKQVKAEVEEEVSVEPLYRAMNYLKTGVMINAKGEEVTSDGKHRIDIDMILKMYSLEPDVLKPNLTALMRGKYRMIGKDGAHPDALAALFGFDSGDRMIRALMGARSYKDEVVARTDARMLAEYGDMNTPAAQQAAVERALHTEARSRFVAVELRFLTKISQPVRVMIDAARRAAQQTIDSTVIRQLRPGDFSNAEARAGKEADEALRAVDRKRKTPDQIEEEAYKESLATQIAAGVDEMTADGVAVQAGLDARKSAEAREAAYLAKYKGRDPLEVAITAKQRQMLNNQLAEVAIDVRDDIDAGVRYLRKVLNPKNIKRMGADTSDQIAKILSFYSLRKLTAEEAANKLTLQQWLLEQEELGIVPDIDPALLDEANRKSFQEMTVAEFRELVETVEQLEYIARNADKARIAGEKVKFGEERDALTESIIENKRGRMGEMPRTENTAGRRAAAKGRMFFADHLKVAFIARIFDGDKDGGKMWNWFIRTANICGDKETSMIAAATKVIMKALEPVKALGNMEGDARFFPTIGMSLTRGERFVIALNMGNEGNMQRLQDGFGWTDAQLEPVIATISSTEWEAVQKIWDHFATYKDEVGAMERRLNGKEPTWIEIRPITVKTSDGKTMTLDGGYYPIKYDPRASDRVEQEMDSDKAKAAQRGAFTAATTRQSYTKSRADKVTGRKLLLNMSGVWGGLSEVIHDLSWREWLIHANRMARDPKFTETVSKAYGFEIKQQIKKWIKAIAEGNSAQQEGNDAFAIFARQAVSVARLGINVMSGVAQVSGYANTVVRIGAKWAAVGAWTYTQNPRACIRGVNEKSSMMRNLSMTQFRDLNEIKNVAQDQDGLWKKYVANAFIFCKIAQSIVNYPTWEGAYAKALHSGASDQLAIDLADQAVIDSQGSGQLKDLSTVQRGGAWQKLFTVFMDYQNSLYGQMAVQVMTKSRVRAAANLTLLVVVPAVLKYYQKQLLKPQRDDDEEEQGLALFVAEESAQTIMGTMIGIREFSGLATFDQSRDYRGPTGLSTIVDLYALKDQALQNEWDAAYRRALLNAAGDLFGLPAVQINRTVDGIDYMMENETADPRALIFGTRAK